MMRKLFAIIFIFSLLSNNVIAIEADIFVQSTVNRASKLLSENISKEEKIKKLGLAKGGSLDNAVVVQGDKVLNIEGLRNQKEFVNHKILDLAGDFLLSGYRILGKIECHQGGHELSNMFLRKLLKFTNNYSIIELESTVISKKINSEQAIKLAVNA